MYKLLFTLIALILIGYNSALADDFDWGMHTNQELEMQRYPADTNARAVILNEYGKSYISTAVGIRLIFEYHVKIKVLTEKGLDEGNVVIPLYKTDNMYFETVRDIKGQTTYTDENGNVKVSELETSKIFRVNEGKHYELMKFDLPNVRKGCIVEYKYVVETPYFHNFRKWEFQAHIPKVHSEYHASIPAVFNYNIALHGALKLTSNKGEINRNCFVVHGTSCDCSELTYAMDNIPAFEREEYMTSEKNFISAITFELADYIDFSNGAKIKVAQDWNAVDYTLKTNEYFGTQIKRKELMKDRIKGIIADKTDELSKAKAIYQYIQKNIKWNEDYGKYSLDGIRNALDNHKGNIGDINLALIAALKAADINTEVVLLATREHGLVNKLYPTESDFDYVIAKVNIGGSSYFLDASDPLLGFGILPLHCINDQGRAISFDKPSYWIDIKEPQKKSAMMAFDLTLQPNGKLKGTYTKFGSGYEGYLMRKAIKKFNSVDEFVENLDEHHNRIKILNSQISNLDSLDQPISEKYEIEVDAFKDTNHTLNFNPYLMGRETVNPFKLTDRTFPVDMGMPSESRMVLVLHLPADFTIVSTPKNEAVSLPGNGGRLIINSAQETDNCTYSEMVQFNKPVYATEEYPYLKEFLNKIIQSESADIVIQKK